MNPTLKNAVIAGIVALVVTLGIYWFTQPATPIAQLGNTTTTVPEPGGTVLPNGEVLPNPSTSDYTVERVYDAMFALGLWDGTSNPVHIQAVRNASFIQATTTPCSLQNPFNATSTLLDAVFNPTTSTSTSYQMQIATSSTQYTTNSVLVTFTEAANGITPVVVSSATSSSNGSEAIIPPSGWVNDVTTGSQAIAVAGTCSAIFETIN